MTRDSENSLGGYRSNEEWDDLMAQVASLISGIESLEDKNTKHQIYQVLDGIDAIHREALHRLVRLFKEGVLEQVIPRPYQVGATGVAFGQDRARQHQVLGLIQERR